MSNESYTSKDIKVLSQLEHLRANPGMYIGVTDTPTHLLYEVLDNALDEANMGFAKLILVKIDPEKNVYTVADNGRGIPFEDNSIVTIVTSMFSGAKFKKGENSSYGAAIGLHGIGLFAVAGLSEWMKVCVYRDGKRAYYEFVDCQVKNSKIEDWDPNEKKVPASTIIEFKPSSKYFESTKVDVEAIRQRLQLASVHIDNLKLIYINGKEQEVIKMTMNDYFECNFWKKCSKENRTPLWEVSKKVKGESVSIKFGWDLSSYSQPIAGGSVNLLPVDSGTHINRTYTLFKDVFINIAKKEKLNYNENDYKIGLRCYTATQLFKPGYDGQTKKKLNMRSSELDHLYKDLEKEVENKLREDPEIFQKLIYFVDSYRQSLNAKGKIVKSQKGQVSRFTQVLDSKLKDCSSGDVEKCQILICEGDSAAGTIIQARNPKYDAVLGLKGKVPNLAMNNKDFLKNKELCEFINALGCGIGDDFDIDSLRYNCVIIATDGDADGSHIASLLITALLKIVPKLFDCHKIYRATMPLYGVKKFKGKFLPFYNEEDMLKFKAENPKIQITRYKGLGEMDPDELAACVLDKDTRKLQEISRCESELEAKEIFKMMSDAESKREMLDDTEKE